MYLTAQVWAAALDEGDRGVRQAEAAQEQNGCWHARQAQGYAPAPGRDEGGACSTRALNSQ